MAQTKSDSNGHLDEALRDLVKSQAALNQAMAARAQLQATLLADNDRLRRQSDERFARIEAILLEHSRILTEHTRILEALPDAVRQRMGFRPGE